MKPLTQQQIAAILGLTPRRVQQLEAEFNGPPHDEDGYSPAKFGDWMRSKTSETDKTRLLKAQADLAQMDAEERRGEQAKLTDVVSAWGDDTAAVRARALNLPKAAAPLVVGLSVAEAEAVIERLVYEMLSELADGIPRRVNGRSHGKLAHSQTAA